MSYCFEQAIPHSKFLEWDPEDRAKVLAYSMERAARCAQCGTAPWEWEENRFAYTAVEEFCNGCYQKSVFSDTQSKPLPGTNVKLIPTTPQLIAQMLVKGKKRERMMRERKE
jgi:hypothetical protein